MNGYIPASGIHLPPPILPIIGPAQVGAAELPGVPGDGVKSGIDAAHRIHSEGIPAGAFAGAGLGIALGYLGGAIGGGMGTYYFLLRDLGTGWRTGLSVAGSLLVLGPIGASLGAVIGAWMGW